VVVLLQSARTAPAQSLAKAQSGLRGATDFYREARALAQQVSNSLVGALALSSLAGVAVRQEQPACAAWMWGAASPLRDAIKSGLPLEEEARFAGPISAARAILGEDVFAAAGEAGGIQPLEQMVADALTLGNERA
jgi:hypothetical protein